MAHKILLRAKRFATTSDRQREKLQAQISVYALRHHADKDIELQAGTNGQATLSVVTDQFGGGSSTVPEPGTLSMLGIGAMAVFQFARRKIRR